MPPVYRRGHEPTRLPARLRTRLCPPHHPPQVAAKRQRLVPSQPQLNAGTLGIQQRQLLAYGRNLLVDRTRIAGNLAVQHLQLRLPFSPLRLVPLADYITLLGRPAGTGFELSMSLYNVFDKHYGTPGSADHVQTLIPQNGRTVLGKLVYRFK